MASRRHDLDDVQIRRANADDAEAIMDAHLDSILSIGPAFYPTELVQAWSAGLAPEIYVNAMSGGETFFVATGMLDDKVAVLGFSSHQTNAAQDGTSVYVRGRSARRGLGTLLLQQAEDHARARGATSLQIQASLPGVDFYKANGFEALERSDVTLRSGHTIPCVSMRKLL